MAVLSLTFNYDETHYVVFRLLIIVNNVSKK